MFEERLDDELAAIEAALASLRPVRSRIRRDRLLLAAQMSAAPRSRLAGTGLAGGRRAIGWAAGFAAAACLLLAVTWFWPGGRGPSDRAEQAGPPGTPIQLAAGWQIQPTGKAVYRVVKPESVQLERGELLVESLPPANGEQVRPALCIQTPAGTATAAGTKFYIGSHPLTPNPSESRGATMKSFTRVLVLAGMVTLANAQGSVTGQANHLLAAEAGKPPVDRAVTANSDFAVDLYQQLCKEEPGKNLFFSPYSMSSALAMTAEGARGQTAAEMGKVLCFPEAARRIGDDAQLIPWNVALMHTGVAALNERFNAPKPGHDQEVREKIDGLRKQLDAAKNHVAELRKAGRLRKVRSASAKVDELAKELNKLLAQVDQYELHVANALWAEKTYPLAPSYLDTIRKYYIGGGMFPVDFINQPEPARLRINAWVEEQTHNRIKELLAQGQVDSLTRLVLTNAIYFKGEWAEVFQKDQTKEDDFLLADGAKARVPMMHRDGLGSASYAAFNGDGTFFDTPRKIDRNKPPQSSELYPDEHGFTMLEMPYKGDDLAMVVIVPRAADGLSALEKSLTSASVQNWIGKLQQRKVNAFMPKFKLETAYNMNEALQALGMPLAFVDPTKNPKGADFSGMCDIQNPTPYQSLYIGLVVHKAFVEVDEKGTEAAAATAVVMQFGSPAPPRMVPFTPTFRADKPFLFLIRDKHTGCILFLGRMISPKG